MPNGHNDDDDSGTLSEAMNYSVGHGIKVKHLMILTAVVFFVVGLLV